MAFVGREDDVRRLGKGVAGALAGRGRSILVEGEPGIGKSTLLRVGLGQARQQGCRVLWGAADELGQRVPMRTLLECFDGERAGLLGIPASGQDTWLAGPGDPTLVLTERVLALVDRYCAAGPVLLVLDDLQWADEASLRVWQRLARSVDQLPLLLVAASRPAPKRIEVAQLRRLLLAADTMLITLEPLAAAEVGELVETLVGARTGPKLSELAARAGGNPLYVTELVDALVRENRIRVRTTAELTGDPAAVPESLIATILDRLAVLSEPTAQSLRIAALLGPVFSAMDLSAVTVQPPTTLLSCVDEGIAAGVLTSSGERIAFRHPLIRQALYAGIPRGLRATLHRQTAKALAGAGAAFERVAEQLLAAGRDATDEWALDWLSATVLRLARRAPEVAATLTEQALEVLTDDDPRRERLEVDLVTILRLLNRFGLAEQTARRVRATTSDPDRAAHMAWIVGYCLLGTRRGAGAVDLLTQALGDPATPPRWGARLRALRAVAFGSLGRHDDALADAGKAQPEGEAADDRYAVALALHAEAQSVARFDTRRALELIERGLTVAPPGLDGLDLKLLMLGNKVTNLTILDHVTEAEIAAREVLRLAEEAGTARHGAIRVVAAQRHFALGHWDDARAELEPVAELARELARNPPKLLTCHGLAALIAVHRDEVHTAQQHLRAVQRTAITPGVLRRASDYLMLARSTLAELGGDAAAAVAALTPALQPEWATDVTRRHPILPDLVRLAMAAGDHDTAAAALSACVGQAELSGVPGLAAAVQRSRGLLDGDASALRSAAEYYRSAGRPLELAHTCEDQAELAGRSGRTADAKAMLADAVEIYTELGADWDVRRAGTRLRRLGIRLGHRGRRHRPAGTGWEALTPTELTVARLVASGLSNPDIAARLFLSRRTVQSHVSHILRKLQVRSRVDITREVLRQASR